MSYQRVLDSILDEMVGKVDVRYGEWLDEVAEEVKTQMGLTLDELPDQPYLHWYKSDLLSSQVVPRIRRHMRYAKSRTDKSIHDLV